jgi:hypothetical protein
LRSILSVSVLAIGSAAISAHACNMTFGEESEILAAGSEWNVMEARYNSNLGEWEVVGVTYDPAADAYSPQAGDIVMVDENDEIALIFISVSGDGGGDDGGGGDVPPPVIQGSRDSDFDSAKQESDRDPELELTCLSDPPTNDDNLDRILVTGQRFNFSSLRFVAVRRGSFSGGGGGGGGGSLFRRIPHNPQNSETSANCSSLAEIRVNYASQELAPHMTGLFPSVRVGDTVVITYRNNQRENFSVICASCTIRATPIAGTCQ